MAYAQHVNLVSVTPGFDTFTAAGRLLCHILMDFAEFEREMISERTKDKMLARAQKADIEHPMRGQFDKGSRLVLPTDGGF
jgi:DNA invertase Pin-like site-specific DNA recombinase